MSGVSATEFLLDNLRARARREGYTEAEQLKEALGDLLLDLLSPLAKPLDTSTTHPPFVIMLAGVNGSGKTTSIGKLARYYQQQGKKILLAAGDTFRAAAREQLIVWGERNNVAVDHPAIRRFRSRHLRCGQRRERPGYRHRAGRHGRPAADAASSHGRDQESETRRSTKALPGAPHEVLLVLDANTGQNALAQVKAFDDALGVTGLIMTKLDGTAKGGVIAAIAHTRSKSSSGEPIPLRFIGVGEGIDDLQSVRRGGLRCRIAGRRRNGGVSRSRNGRPPAAHRFSLLHRLGASWTGRKQAAMLSADSLTTTRGVTLLNVAIMNFSPSLALLATGVLNLGRNQREMTMTAYGLTDLRLLAVWKTMSRRSTAFPS